MPRKPSGRARMYMLSVRLSEDELLQYASILVNFLSINPGYARAQPIDSSLFRRLLDELAPAGARETWKRWAEPATSRIKEVRNI